MDRRTILKSGAAAAVGGVLAPSLARAAQFNLPPGAADQPLETLPGKAELIRKTYRPPNYESPVSYLGDEVTANDKFFVRYHLAGIPDSIDPATWKLDIGGPGAGTPVSFTLDDLKGMEKVELVAVNQCSGNRRGFSDPHVAGVEWGFGAMGNAKWGGVRLKDLLAKAGLAKEVIEISFDGADGPVDPNTPDFVKSLPLSKAMDDNTLVAYEMNGEALPHFNGAPARLIVPGWTGTYWMKHLTTVQALTEPLKNFWMATAYRVPSNLFPLVARFASQESPNSPNTPITEMVVNSMITNFKDGDQVKAGQATDVKGIAWDGGYGITDVEVSIDGGKTWDAAALGNDLGKYSWRQWTYSLTAASPGSVTVMVRARNNAGQTQVDKALFNGSGYHHNAVQALPLTAV